ncbi:hypothetical protein KKG31_08120 [Patescibacteria group bacterium]|nr:hypothetical protein [Patescibacteria group bacterium]MBU1759028.1 hypothetical protein [Patescibacteria group bacterium]
MGAEQIAAPVVEEKVPVVEQTTPVDVQVAPTEEEQTQNSISQVNALLQEEEQGPTIDISNIQIEEMTNKEQRK